MTSNFLIIGGNSDIASVLIEYLLQQDAQITVLVRQDGDSSIHSSGVNMIVGDATQEDDLQKAIDKALENGKIDGIVHCVGSIVIRPPHAMKKDAFEEVILTNLTSAFLTLSLGGKSMIRNGGGRMVFCSSVAGSLGLVNHEAISAAKGGVESMVRSAAATYAQRGLRINAVAPGLTDTKMASKILASEAMRDAAQDKIPLRRLNQKQEVAQTIQWLLTGAPDNFTGQVLHLDGGMSKILV
jgi:NAD(P)-dependent dehydrogenase (short-subunit alcohol dehydrogenase family)